jgi:hypothetical protein
MTLSEATAIAQDITVNKKHALQCQSVEEVAPMRFLATFGCAEPPSKGVLQDRLAKAGAALLRYSDAKTNKVQVIFCGVMRNG